MHPVKDGRGQMTEIPAMWFYIFYWPVYTPSGLKALKNVSPKIRLIRELWTLVINWLRWLRSFTSSFQMKWVKNDLITQQMCFMSYQRVVHNINMTTILARLLKT